MSRKSVCNERERNLLRSDVANLWRDCGTEEEVRQKLSALPHIDCVGIACAAPAPAMAPKANLTHRYFATRRQPEPENDSIPQLLLVHAQLTEPFPASPVHVPMLVSLGISSERAAGIADAKPDLLILAGTEAGEIDALYFHGRPCTRQVLIDHIARLSMPQVETSLLEMDVGRHCDWVELWVRAADGAGHARQRKQLSDLADALLDALLSANRPVADWRTNYFMPVRLVGALDADRWASCDKRDPAEHQAEQDYFLQSANRVLGIGDGEVLESQVARNHPATLQIVNPKYGDEALSARIAAVRLHRFGGNELSALLEWEAVPLQTAKPQIACTWHRYLAESKSPSTWSLAQLLDFHAEARFIKHHYPHEVEVAGRVKPTYIQIGEHGLEVNNGKTMLDLLGGFSGIAPLQGGRDRAFAMASVILDGSTSPSLDPLLASLNVVDPYSPSGFYDPAFGMEEFRNSQYRRFWNRGTHYLATDHSFSMLSFRQDKMAIARGDLGYAEKKIHGQHMRTMYHRLFLLCVFQQQGLDDIGEMLAAHSDWSDRPDQLRRLRQVWIDMRAARWFASVSTELQGEEIYHHMRHALRIDLEAAVIDKNLVDLEKIYIIEHEKTEERRKNLLEFFAIPLGVFLVIRETMYTGGDEYPEAFTHVFENIMHAANFHNAFYSLVFAALAISGFIWLYLRGYFSALRPRVRLGKLLQRLNWLTLLYLVALVVAAWLSVTNPPFQRHCTKLSNTTQCPDTQAMPSSHQGLATDKGPPVKNRPPDAK